MTENSHQQGQLRLSVFDSGLRRPAKILFATVGLLTRHAPQDALRIALYRPGFFGYQFVLLATKLLRGPSQWTAGERELFGSFTSKLNQCPY